jgi:hypothetical protein
LRTIHGAEMTYQSTTGAGNFAKLNVLYNNNLVDSQLGTVTSGLSSKSGYNFSMGNTDKTSGAAATFGVKADPITIGGVSATGTRSFAIGTEGVIYTGTAATGTFTVADTQTNGNNVTGTSTALNN